MTAHQVIVSDGREVVEIDALIRALRHLRHWSASAAARRDYRDDYGARLYATAARLRDEAWADGLLAAHRLFEIDAIHQAWIEGRLPAAKPDLAQLLASIADAEAQARHHDAAGADRDFHAARAQHADERAEAGRRAARAMIEATFSPKVR